MSQPAVSAAGSANAVPSESPPPSTMTTPTALVTAWQQCPVHIVTFPETHSHSNWSDQQSIRASRTACTTLCRLWMAASVASNILSRN